MLAPGGVLFVTNNSGNDWEPAASPALPSATGEFAISGDGKTLYALANDTVYDLEFPESPVCIVDANTLCLNDGRFRVSVVWEAEHNATSGPGKAVPLAADTGAFWFFSPSNLELMVKVVDGRALNGKYWVFAGALSNVAYTVTVRDMVTGEARAYVNPQDQLGSIADTSAFEGGESAPAVAEAQAVQSVTPFACDPDPSTLCLHDGRFRVRVSFDAENIEESGTGTAVPIATDTGAFWFFSANNLELIVKVVDGRAFNDHFWVFYGALSNVHYTITVLDTETGMAKTYENPQGKLASQADTEAF